MQTALCLPGAKLRKVGNRSKVHFDSEITKSWSPVSFLRQDLYQAPTETCPSFHIRDSPCNPRFRKSILIGFPIHLTLLEISLQNLAIKTLKQSRMQFI